MGLNFLGRILITLRQFTEHGDLGEIGSELIVKVARDSSAFLLKGFLLL